MKKQYTGSTKTKNSIGYWGGFSIATFCLIALNIIFFVGSRLIDLETLSKNYGVIPSSLTFIALIQSAFLHVNALHIITNLIFLWYFGRRVERAIGPIAFVTFYVGAGIMASLLHVAIAYAFLPAAMQKDAVLGASGAIAGVLGLYAILYRNDRARVGRTSIPAVFILLAWLAVQLMLGGFQIIRAVDAVAPPTLGPFDLQHVGYWSHIGGFIFGMGIAWFIVTKKLPLAGGPSLEFIRKSVFKQVIRSYEIILGQDEDDAVGNAEIARVFALAGNQKRAVNHYLKAAETYRKDGKRHNATICLKDVDQFFPESVMQPDVRFRVACAHESHGNVANAAERFARLASDASGQSEGEMSLLKLGQVQLDRLGDPAAAIQSLNRLILEYPASKWLDTAKLLIERAESGEKLHDS